MSIESSAIVANHGTESAAKGTRKPRGRSRVTNGRAMFAGWDGRTKQGRLFLDIKHEWTERLGGEAALTGELRRRITLLAQYTVALDDVGTRQARGEQINLDDLVRLGHARDALERRLTCALPKKREPTGTAALAAHLARRAAEKAEGGGDVELEEAIE